MDTGKKLRAFAQTFFPAEIRSGARLGLDHPGPGAGSTGSPRRRGVVQTKSARNRLKRTLRGSDRRSEQVGSGVDQWTTPRRIFLVGGWTGPRRLAEGRRPRWSKVVQAARCGRGPAPHPGAVRNRRAMRFRVDWPSMGRCGMHAARTQLGGPPPGSLICEYLSTHI